MPLTKTTCTNCAHRVVGDVCQKCSTIQPHYYKKDAKGPPIIVNPNTLPTVKEGDPYPLAIYLNIPI